MASAEKSLVNLQWLRQVLLASRLPRQCRDDATLYTVIEECVARVDRAIEDQKRKMQVLLDAAMEGMGT